MKRKPTSRSSRSKIRASAALPLSAVLPAVGESLKLDRKVQEITLLSVANQILREKFKDGVRAVGLGSRGKETVLWLQAESAAQSTELSFYLDEIRADINRYLPQIKIQVDACVVKIGG